MNIFKALCLIILAASFVSAQKPKISQNKSKYVPKIVTRAGWTTPVFAPNLTENIRQIEELANPSEIPSGFDIKTRRYHLTEERLVQVESYNEQITALDKRNTFVVREFAVLEYKGRIFAYKLFYYGADAYENGVVRGYFGCFRPAVYVDEDGDGKFKLHYRNPNVYLPQWIYEAENEKMSVPQSNWTGAFLTGAVESSDARFSPLIDDVDVDSKMFYFNRERLINFELCSKDGETTKVQYVGDRYYTFETKGRVFAYEFPQLMTPKLPRITEPDSKETPTGIRETGRSVLFVDEDGDGTFEQNCDRKTLTPLPQWVVDLGVIKVKTAGK